MENNTKNIEIASIVADECVHKFKSLISRPLHFSEVYEDGSMSEGRTELGEQFFDIIYWEVKQILDRNK